MNEPITFIGVDLAWQSDKNPSGIVVARGSISGAALVYCSSDITPLQNVVDCIISHSKSNTVIAIDAPLIIDNETGQRPCEKSIGQKFGKYHAAAHSSNLKRYPDPGGVRLAQYLEEKGFSHSPNPTTDKLRTGRWFFEVYPHPAHVVLFDLDRIIKYKKGRVAEKRRGLQKLCQHLKKLVGADPPFLQNEKLKKLLQKNVEELRGKSLKQYEDNLDALLCAYLALFYWRWGEEKNEMIGDLKSGYIINPTEPL
jgi:predicted RNase H-like nuclease